jgi:hypothetical protein
VLVQGDEAGPVRDAERGEQPLGDARVLGGHDLGVLERLPQPRRGVAEVADGRRREDDHRSSLAHG